VPVEAIRCAEPEYDRTNSVELVLAWVYGQPNPPAEEVVKGLFGPGTEMMVAVPDTPYCLILMDGVVQPALYDVSDHSYWRIRGLGKYFSKCSGIFPRSKQLTLGAGLGDMNVTWEFDFSDPRVGLKIKYDCDGGY